MLIDLVKGSELVMHCCAQAEAAGVQRDMTLAHARALLHRQQLHVEYVDRVRDEAALLRLARWALRYVPTAAVDCEAGTPSARLPGLLMNISGCERLYHGERSLLRTLLTAVQRLGFEARLAAAPTFGCAWAAARFGSAQCASIAEHELRDVLAELPVAALRIDDEVIDGLMEVGVQTIGEMLRIPRRRLAARFGRGRRHAAGVIERLDQALGQAIEVIEPVRIAPPLAVSRCFDGPVKDIEAITLATRELLQQLCSQLERLESGVWHLRVQLERSDCDPLVIDVPVSRPCRSVKHLWSLVFPKLERAHLGYGIEAIKLTALSTGRLAHEQQSVAADGTQHDAAHEVRELGQLIDVLGNRLGRMNITQVELRESYLPERAQRHVPVDLDAKHVDAQIVEADRPSMLFSTPEAADVLALTPDGPVAHMHWRAKRLRIVSSIGPERITAEWWRRREPTRDYFKVQDEQGRWLWVYRELETRRWFIHGLWA